MIAGFDPESNVPKLFKVDPSGIYTAWRAASTGKNDSDVLELLEKKFVNEMDDDAAVQLTVQALLEVVDAGDGSIEVCVLRPGNRIEFLTQTRLDEIAAVIEAEKEAEKKKKGGDDDAMEE